MSLLPLSPLSPLLHLPLVASAVTLSVGVAPLPFLPPLAPLPLPLPLLQIELVQK